MLDLPQIPGFVTKKEVGRGGVARVYLAYDTNLDRNVAIKMMSLSKFEDNSLAKRFVKEAKISGRLNHSNIVSVYKTGRHMGIYYIVMEYLPGGNLKQKMKKSGLEESQAIQVLIQISNALGYAHKKGFLHRDIKPENIMFREDGTPVLVDFGIAKAFTTETKLTKTGSSVGTMLYMSPNQALGEKLDSRADIYSLGVVFFEMLTGDVPYRANSNAAVLFKHVQEPIPELSEKFIKYQPVINKMLAKEVKARLKTGQLVVSLVREIEQGKYMEQKPDKDFTESGNELILDDNAEVLNIGKTKKMSVPLIFLFLVILTVLIIFFFSGELDRKSDSGAWQRAVEYNTIASYQDYLRIYSEGENLNEAKQRIKDFEKISEELEKLKEDEKAYRIATIKGSVKGYEKYLLSYPYGKSVDAARGKISELRERKKISDEKEKNVKKDKEPQKEGIKEPEENFIAEKKVINSSDVFELAKQIDSIESYQAYLKQHPDGDFVEEAKRRLSIIQKGKRKVVEIRDNDAFRRASLQNSIPALQKYLEEYPDGVHILKAKNQIDMIEKNNFDTDVLKIRWQEIPKGDFRMGSDTDISDNNPSHTVELSTYYISRYEITFLQYDLFCEETNTIKPDDDGWGRKNHPVINVSWTEAKRFCEWLSKKTDKLIDLPTEAQWEKACKAGISTRLYGKIGEIAWYNMNASVFLRSGRTFAVGQKKPNPFGLFDILGNVSEWCNDRYKPDFYLKSKKLNPEGPLESKTRVVRGGSWRSTDDGIGSAIRDHLSPHRKYDYIGFRIVRKIQ